MQVAVPPFPVIDKWPRPWLFLGGSIEMGKAVDWQQELIRRLGELDGTILNPRRSEQSIDNPQFSQQVSWELAAQEDADIIAFWFVPGTKSPITLLELGLFHQKPKMLVGCPDGFWRKGNVDIVCRRYGILERESWSSFVTGVRGLLVGTTANLDPKVI